MSKGPSAPVARRRSERTHRWVLLGSNITLAVCALAWVAYVTPNLTSPAIPQVASRISRGERYDLDQLRQIIAENLPAARKQCSVKTMRELLLLQLAIADEATRSGDLKQADTDTGAVAASSRALSLCAPSEGIGWLGSYWSAIRQDGFGPRTATFLGLSYKFAPHEAWLQLIRAPLALRVYGALSPELKTSAVQDFDDVFRARLFPSAAALYQAAAASVRTELLDRTCGATEVDRELFRRFITDKGFQLRHPCYPSDERPAHLRD
ncbi:hypothetical protein WHZ77_26670 [Bradyrhizobium sp. A5]|uniref:hypothetical protein n=1 Tax=Bradyrhizobium sp. A5 TaxID=3133696 RepID=UPI003247A3D0